MQRKLREKTWNIEKLKVQKKFRVKILECKKTKSVKKNLEKKF